MDKKLFLKIKVYLKNGCIINELAEYEGENEQEIINDHIEQLKDRLSFALKTNVDFSIDLGETVFRGADISAVTLTLENNNI